MEVYLHKTGEQPPFWFLLLQEQDISSRSNFTVPHYVQVLILKGRGHLIDESSGEEFELRPGSLIQRYPGKVLTQQFTTTDCQQLFFLAPPQIHDFIVTGFGEQPACIQHEDPFPLRRQWIDFSISCRNKTYTQSWLALPALFAAGLRGSDTGKDWLQQARELLSEDRLSPEEVAAKLGMSYASFRTRFRNEQGTPPAAYRRTHRMTRACNLLAGTDLSVSEIAELLSYNDIFSFSRQFKRECGLSPQLWRKQNS